MFTKRTAVIIDLKLSTPTLTTDMLIFSASAGVDEACTGVEERRPFIKEANVSIINSVDSGNKDDYNKYFSI